MKKKPASKTPTPLYRQKSSRKKTLPKKLGLANVTGNGTCVICEEPPDDRCPRPLRCIELFAGAGGLAIAASNAGFEHDAVLEFNRDACETIRANQRRGLDLVGHWPLIEGDVHHQDFSTWADRVE